MSLIDALIEATEQINTESACFSESRESEHGKSNWRDFDNEIVAENIMRYDFYTLEDLKVVFNKIYQGKYEAVEEFSMEILVEVLTYGDKISCKVNKERNGKSEEIAIPEFVYNF